MNKRNIKLLTIVAIIALFAASWYSLFNNSVKLERKYNECVEIARNKRKSEIYGDALTSYNQALEMKDTIELRDEIAQMYMDGGYMTDYAEFCSDIITKYPHESKGYERLAQYYIRCNELDSFFELVNMSKKRGISSSYIDEMVAKEAYTYELTNNVYEEVSSFASGYAAVKKKDGNWGYLNEKGKLAIKYEFRQANSFNASGYAAVKNQKHKFVLIDENAEVKVTDTQDRRIEDCTCLIANKIAVKYDGKYHYCDSELKYLFGEYDYAGSFGCGVAAVKDGDNWYVIDEKGEKVSDKTFEDIKLDVKGIAFRNNVAFAKVNGKYILIDTKCNQVGSSSWDDADAFNSEQPAAVKVQEKWGFVNATGETVVEPQYAGAKSFANGFAAVVSNDRWGYINLDKYEIVIKCQFDDAGDFSTKGCTFVKSDDYWTSIRIYRLSQ